MSENFEVKICKKCKDEKPINKFYKGRNACIACYREDQTRQYKQRMTKYKDAVQQSTAPPLTRNIDETKNIQDALDLIITYLKNLDSKITKIENKLEAYEASKAKEHSKETVQVSLETEKTVVKPRLKSIKSFEYVEIEDTAEYKNLVYITNYTFPDGAFPVYNTKENKVTGGLTQEHARKLVPADHEVIKLMGLTF